MQAQQSSHNTKQYSISCALLCQSAACLNCSVPVVTYKCAFMASTMCLRLSCNQWKDQRKFTPAQLWTQYFVLCCPQSLPVHAPLLQDPDHGNLISTQKTPETTFYLENGVNVDNVGFQLAHTLLPLL